MRLRWRDERTRDGSRAGRPAASELPSTSMVPGDALPGWYGRMFRPLKAAAQWNASTAQITMETFKSNITRAIVGSRLAASGWEPVRTRFISTWE